MAHAFTIQSFFNSLFVDMQGELVQSEFLQNESLRNESTGELRSSACFQVQGGQLILPLSYCSPTGRHRYQGDVYFDDHQQIVSVTLPQALDLVLAYYDQGDAAKRDRLLQRIGASDHYIQRAIQYAQDQRRAVPSHFIASEQALFGGHSMHPTPKSCEPLSHEDQIAYLPEYGNQFSLQWFAVDKSIIEAESVNGDALEQLARLFELSVAKEQRSMLDEGWIAYPMHPLQAKAWLESEEYQALNGKIYPLDTQSDGWQATSSSRAIYHPDLPWMLKISLPVKLTNSLRLLSVKEAKRGTLFSRLLAHDAGQELIQRNPTTTFIEEPAWLTLTSQKGEPLALPLISLRTNPFYQGSSDQVHLLASVNQAGLNEQAPQVVGWVKELADAQAISLESAACLWMGAFMQQVMTPLCMARSDYGMVLLAHQQNILLRIEQGLPVGMMYRDCQGSGVTDLALKRFAEVFDDYDAEYFMEGEEVNPYLAYYLIGNSLINTVATIAASGVASEATLFAVCREHLAKLAAAFPLDGSFYRYLLESPTLHWKRNFLCFVEEHNEATLSDPAQIYRSIANPLSQGELPQCVKPLPDDTHIALYDDGCGGWSLQTNANERGVVRLCDAASHDSNEDLAAEQYQIIAMEPLVWWSGLEHVFYHTGADEVRLAEVPDTVRHLCRDENLISKRTFLENAPIWHRADKPAEQSVRLTTPSGTTHPTRPQKPTNIFYQRYFYHSKRTVTLRVAALPRDLSGFHRWHNDPAIAPIWELAGTRQEHHDYLAKMVSDPHQFPVIGEFDGVPFGYFELYWVMEDRLGPYYDCEEYDRGAHMVSANKRYRGWRYFETWSCAILHYCFLAQPKTQHIMGEPRADNKMVIELTKRIGFDHLFDFDFPHKRAAMLQCPRDRYFDLYAL